MSRLAIALAVPMAGCAVAADEDGLQDTWGATSAAETSGRPPSGDTGDAPGTWSSTSGDATSTDPGDTGLVFDLGAGDLPKDDGACGCAPGTELVYALSSLGELWTFDPETTAFEHVGTVDCPVFSSAMFSLAIDRRGTVFVEYRSTGDVFQMSLDDITCQDPGYEPPEEEPRRFGLGFVRADGEACERMLGLSYDGTEWSEGPGAGQLVEIDPASMQRTPLASIDYNGGEFAGTGEGRVFAFAGAPQAELVELSLDGSVLETTPLPGVELTDAFAMAHWGGDFYIFVQSALDEGRSTVLRLDYDESDGPGRTLSEVVTAPMLVVGASSSTCAPTEPAG